MSAVAEKIITTEDYLSMERNNLNFSKNEFFNFQLLTMPGASGNHNKITSNLVANIYFFAEEKGFIITQSDMRVNDPNGNYFYPDIVVTKGEHQYLDDGYLDNLINPFLIIEVLSESTSNYDRTQKFSAYRTIESLQEYILVSQEKIEIEGFYKKNNQWLIGEVVNNLDEKFHFRSLNLDLELKKIYKNTQDLTAFP